MGIAGRRRRHVWWLGLPAVRLPIPRGLVVLQRRWSTRRRLLRRLQWTGLTKQGAVAAGGGRRGGNERVAPPATCVPPEPLTLRTTGEHNAMLTTGKMTSRALRLGRSSHLSMHHRRRQSSISAAAVISRKHNSQSLARRRANRV